MTNYPPRLPRRRPSRTPRQSQLSPLKLVIGCPTTSYSYVLPTLSATAWHFINLATTSSAYSVVPGHRKSWINSLSMNGTNDGVGLSRLMYVYEHARII